MFKESVSDSEKDNSVLRLYVYLWRFHNIFASLKYQGVETKRYVTVV